MAYRKRSSKPRRYKKTNTQSNYHVEQSTTSAETALSEEPILSLPAPTESQERKKSQPLGFLSSLFGGDRSERSGNPLFTVFDFDIYLDDLLLAGLLVLLLTDKVQDEILIIVLLYLLLDIF